MFLVPATLHNGETPGVGCTYTDAHIYIHACADQSSRNVDKHGLCLVDNTLHCNGLGILDYFDEFGRRRRRLGYGRFDLKGLLFLGFSYRWRTLLFKIDGQLGATAVQALND